MARNAQHAKRYLSSVEPGDLDALQALAPEDLEQIIRRIRLQVRTLNRSGEVESLACLIAGRLHTGNHEKTARAAVALADQTVRQAYAGVDSLDAWNATYGDMAEAIVHAGQDRSDMPRAWAPSPEDRYRTTDADVIAACLDALQGTEHGRILRDASRAYLEHGDRRCALCQDPSTAGRRVALLGILAHTRGLSSTDSEYHVIRRAMLAALRAVPGEDIRREFYYGHVLTGRAGSVHLERPDVLTGAREVTEPVTVRRADGTGYRTTHARVTAHAPDRSEEDRRADLVGERIAGAPSRAVKIGNRKRGTGTGAYGSQVSARPSRG